MRNFDEKIERLKKMIKRMESKINNLKKENDKEQELLKLNRILDCLKEELKTSEEQRIRSHNYTNMAPSLGDFRYKNFHCKSAIDMLRLKYYEYFNVDPSISYVENHQVMFGDPTLPIHVMTYLIRGKISFKIMFTSSYPNYSANENYSVGIMVNREDIERLEFDAYLSFMNDLIKLYSNNDVNFICSNAPSKIFTMAYISDKDFYYGPQNNKMYYYFFELLCDNNYRNIVYIGDSMKNGVTDAEIEKVESEILNEHWEFIANHLGISLEELHKTNESIRNHLLTYSKEFQQNKR